jgi:hypothetical protein
LRVPLGGLQIVPAAQQPDEKKVRGGLEPGVPAGLSHAERGFQVLLARSDVAQ